MGNRQDKLVTAKLKAKEWQWELKTEAKHLDKEIKKIQVEEGKLRKEIEAQAAKGNVQTVQLLAKQIVQSRKAVNRLEKTKASMHAVNLQLQTSIATMSTTSSLKISADIMARMNKIAGTEEVGSSMEKMKMEMARMADAEDAVEDALRDSDEEEEAAVEMQKVLDEMALDQMGPLAQASAAALAAQPAAAAEQPLPETPTLVPPQRVAVPAGACAEPERPAAPLKAPTAQPAAAVPGELGAAPAVAPERPADLPKAPSNPPAAAPPESLAPAAAPVLAADTAPTQASTAGGGAEMDDLMARLNALKQ